MSELTLEEQRSELTEQALTKACESAGYMRGRKEWLGVESELILEVVKRELAAEWNNIMARCREAKQANMGRAVETIFEIDCGKVGIDAMKKAKQVKEQRPEVA